MLQPIDPNVLPSASAPIDTETCYCNHPSAPCPILSHPQKVLDHGYIKLVETWGSDERVIESARMSTGKGFLGWGPRASEKPCEQCDGKGETDDRGFALRGQPFFQTEKCRACGGDGKQRVAGDEKLLRYLYENAHATPFEFGGLVVEVQAPIFVFREWHRHRTQSFNEMSARYTPLPDLNYVPTVERLMLNSRLLTDSKANKQAGTAKGAEELTAEQARVFQEMLKVQYEDAQKLYDFALAAGIPKELARVHLPVGRYSRMRASANLRNWLAFLTLRMAPNAQYEIRQYANAVGTLIVDRFPRTWELFNEGKTT
jgi:thymidylate synthase (FAD)